MAHYNEMRYSLLDIIRNELTWAAYISVISYQSMMMYPNLTILPLCPPRFAVNDDDNIVAIVPGLKRRRQAMLLVIQQQLVMAGI